MTLQPLIKYCSKQATKGGESAQIYRQILDVLIITEKYDLVPTEVSGEDYQKFVGAYFGFRRERGSEPKMNPAAGKALKEIIRYLLKNKKVQGDPEKALEAWKFILDKWNHLSDYIRQQVGLTQINKHIEEIIEQLTNASKQAKQRANESDISRLKASLKGGQ